VIRFDKVTVKYGEQVLVQDISFHVRERESAVIYGRSGAGKTTILTTIVGAHIPSTGTLYFAGEAVNPSNILEVRRSVSFIGQEPILGTATVREAVLLPYTFKINKGKIPSDEKILEQFERLHLKEKLLEKDTGVVSAGEKQRVAIVRELLQNKKIFLVDELTSALDGESKRAVMELFNDNNYTLISVSHDTDWHSICSKFIMINSGRMAGVSDRPDPAFT
jgi:putative ABC transport system ATP-binding protein